jgi:hypothetical protein
MEENSRSSSSAESRRTNQILRIMVLVSSEHPFGAPQNTRSSVKFGCQSDSLSLVFHRNQFCGCSQ